MRGNIQNDIFTVYDDNNKEVYKTDLKSTKEFIYLADINPKYLPILKDIISKDKILVSDYNRNLINLGFKNPQVCKDKGICLYLPKADTDDIARDAAHIHREYEFLSTQLKSKHCEIAIKISEKALAKLKKIISENKDETKEIFGSFKIIDNKKINGNIVHTLDIVSASLKSGNTDDVTATPTIYNFHTHPVSAYKMYDVKYGPPSVQDYKSIYLLCKDYNCIVHFIASIEGIYVVYLLPDIKENVNKIIDAHFTYDDKTMVLDEYLKKINAVGIFSITLHKWSSAALKVGIKIRFRKSGEWGNCKIRD